MHETLHLETETWRLILLRRNASELLAFRSSGGLYLPSVEIPIHTRVVQVLNREIRTRWGLDVYSLYPLRADIAHPAIRYHVVEALRHDAVHPQGTEWVHIDDLAVACFAEPADYSAVETWNEHLTGTGSNGGRSPLEKPGSLFFIRDLIRDAIQPISLALKEDFLQFNAGSGFSLVRFETDGSAIWFKAVGAPNEHEFPLTITLASIVSSYLPRVLAAHPSLNAWVMLEVPGLSLSRTIDPSAWTNAARDLAEMQIATLERTNDILQCQPRDLRLTTLLAQVSPFFARLSDLMARQTKPVPARLTPEEVAELAIDMREALLELQRENIPDSLGHLDLNPENMIASNGRTVFLDWAEGSLGHPFFSLAYFLEHASRTFNGGAEFQERLIHVYADVWKSAQIATNPVRALSLSVLTAVFAHAVSTDHWKDERKLQEPGMAGYYRSLARRMKCYRDRIHSGASSVTEVLV
jgi:phosphotransferase family enzyme